MSKLHGRERIAADSAHHLGMIAVTDEQWRAMIRVAQQRESSISRLERALAAAREALAALIDGEPWARSPYSDSDSECYFCAHDVGGHFDDCPWLAATALLAAPAAATPGEGEGR